MDNLPTDNNINPNQATAPLQDPVPQSDLEKKDAEALAALEKQDKDIAAATGQDELVDYELPEKFKDVNSLIKSYNELEKKLGSQNKQIIPEPVKTTTETAEQNIVDKYTQKFFENNNTLTDDDYKELEKAGYDKNIVDTYIKGKQAQQQAYENEVLKDIEGGREQYDKLTAWGIENYSDQELTVYNKMVNSGDIVQAKMAVENLKNRYNANNEAPTTTVTGIGGNATGVYNSWAEMHEDMSNPKYRTDPAFQKAVQQKVFNSKSLG